MSNFSLDKTITGELERLEGCEEIDSIISKGERRKRADYLLSSRSIIVEKKNIEAFAARERLAMEQYDIILRTKYGPHPSRPRTYYERATPEEKAKLKSLVQSDADKIKTVISSAKRQIRETKEIFNIPDASGVVLLISDGLDYVLPATINHRSYAVFNEEARTNLADAQIQAVVAFVRMGLYRVRGNPIVSFIASRLPENHPVIVQSKQFLHKLESVGVYFIRENTEAALYAEPAGTYTKF